MGGALTSRPPAGCAPPARPAGPGRARRSRPARPRSPGPRQWAQASGTCTRTAGCGWAPVAVRVTAGTTSLASTPPRTSPATAAGMPRAACSRQSSRVSCRWVAPSAASSAMSGPFPGGGRGDREPGGGQDHRGGGDRQHRQLRSGRQRVGQQGTGQRRAVGDRRPAGQPGRRRGAAGAEPPLGHRLRLGAHGGQRLLQPALIHHEPYRRLPRRWGTRKSPSPRQPAGWCRRC